AAHRRGADRLPGGRDGRHRRRRHRGRVRRRAGRHLRRQVGLADGRRPRDRGRPRRVPAGVRAPVGARGSRELQGSRRHGRAHQEDDRLAGRGRLHRRGGRGGRRQLHADAHGRKNEAAGRRRDRASLVHQFRSQGRQRVRRRCIRPHVQRGADRQRAQQGNHDAHEPGEREAPPAAADRAHPGRATETARDHHASRADGRSQRRVPHVLVQARQLHQDGADPAERGKFRHRLANASARPSAL
ncbi:MAG: Threonine dehydrogenase and related Zn-dependent dehydrogenases, partial [uncultured Lysobacter sp.]